MTDPLRLPPLRATAEEWSERIDPEALLVALVLVPQSYPRNRFFSLYRSAVLRRVRRRASMLRGLVADLASARPSQVELLPRGARFRLRCQLDAVRGTRTSDLSPAELPLVKLALDRACGGALHSSDGSLAAAFATIDAAAVQAVAALLVRLLGPADAAQ